MLHRHRFESAAFQAQICVLASEQDSVERGLLLERQREGVAKAKQDGKYRGRKPTARAKAVEVLRLSEQGLRRIEIARRLDISVASVYTVLADAKRICDGRKVAA
jgi:DNA invertase Pin-like site-specific DNA recombinase